MYICTYYLPDNMYLQDANMFLDIVNIVLDKQRTQERFSLLVRHCISKM